MDSGLGLWKNGFVRRIAGKVFVCAWTMVLIGGCAGWQKEDSEREKVRRGMGRDVYIRMFEDTQSSNEAGVRVDQGNTIMYWRFESPFLKKE